MIQSMNFPLSRFCLQPYGGWENLGRKIKDLGLDGLEAIADPDDLADDIPPALVTGYHMTFFPDWLDFYRQDKAALKRKFGSLEFVESFYRCATPEDLVELFRADLRLGLRLGTPYAVFHVSDVSLEEGYTYRWEHTDKEVLDASIEVINELLRGVEPSFDFLVENQWWPGLTFTEPEKTEYLLSRIQYPRVGVMLDTGHLMNTNWGIRSQKEGVEYILDMAEKHGELSKAVLGLHFHQSLSGAYCRKAVGSVPEGFPLEYYQEFARSYAHIQRIDRHRPWTDGACVRILDRLQPRYLTHELSVRAGQSQLGAVKRQLSAIRRGREDRPENKT